MAHSPGPWKAVYDDYGDEWWFGGNGHGQWVVEPAADPSDNFNIVMSGRGKASDAVKATAAANAKLIAAAPDLLAACREALEEAEIGEVYAAEPHKLQRLRDAIAKATGETP